MTDQITRTAPAPEEPGAETPSTLHHFPLSVPSRFARLALAEHAVTPSFVEERPWERNDDLLAVHPAGTLPVLVDDIALVCGGRSIAEHLDETHAHDRPERRLMPSDPAGRAEVRRLLDWFLDKFEAEVTGYLVEEKIAKRERSKAGGRGGPPDSRLIRAARHNIRYHLRYVAHLADERHWLAGERMTYADLAAAAALSVADHLSEVPWEDEPIAKDWYMRVKSRPSFRSLLADVIKGVTPPEHYGELDF